MLKVLFAERCAWRAMYVYRDGGNVLIFSLGLDPTWPGGAKLFGAIGGRKSCTGQRIAVWNWECPAPFRKSPRWHKLDGRRARA